MAPTLEEITDEDEFEFEATDFAGNDKVLAGAAPTVASVSSRFMEDDEPEIESITSSGAAAAAARSFQPPPPRTNEETKNFVGLEDMDRFKSWYMLYPVYFDRNKSHSQGRRVPVSRAVANPLAQIIAQGCSSMGLESVLEPAKTHPRDWANPGRVRVNLDAFPGADNRRYLYILISKYLQNNPTTESSPLKLKIQGMPPSDKIPEPPAIPRGWNMSKILPIHSPALSGGGVRENLMQDIQNMGGIPGMPGFGAPGEGPSRPQVPPQLPKKKIIRARR